MVPGLFKRALSYSEQTNVKPMKTSVIAASAILAILVLGTGAVVFANSNFMHGLAAGSNSSQSAVTNTSHTSTNSTQTGEHDDQNETESQPPEEGGHFNLTVGSTITFSNLTGHWVAFVHTGDSNESDSQWSQSNLGVQGDSQGNQTSEGDQGNQTSAMNSNEGNSTGSFTFKVANSTDGLLLTIVSGSFTINGTTYTVSGGNVTLNEGNESGFGQGTASGGATFDIHVAGIHGNTTSSAMVGAIKLDVKVGSNDYLVILGNSQGVEEDNQD